MRLKIDAVISLVLLALFLRIFNFSFPAFTTDEARVAYRGYTLSTNGVDELGRKFPYLFNSLNDYQLPLISYISAMGVGFFGKSELGARMPFIIIGLILVLLTYKVSIQLSKDRSFQIFSTLIVATSPVLIFVSKIPNDSVVLTVLFLLLFYLLNKQKLNLSLILLTMTLLILTSKFAWFILMPFVIYTVFIYKNTLIIKDKLKLSLISLVFIFLAFGFFLQIPQGIRSLSENNISLFSGGSFIDAINWIRGQGEMSGWPSLLEKIIINKLLFFPAAILHWLSNIQPAVFFSQFTKDGSLGFIGMGAFPKITIIPALVGLIFLIREKRTRLLLYPIIMTLPAAVIYPPFSPQLVILTLPFISFIIAFGLCHSKRIFSTLIIIFIGLELLINFYFLSYQVIAADEVRPYGIKPIIQDVFALSKTEQIFLSDDFTEDPGSFIQWYTPIKSQADTPKIPYPYKIRQTNFENIKLIGFSDNFRACNKGEGARLFLSKRDLDRVKNITSDRVLHTYFNSKNEATVYLVEGNACIN